jgi:hypothetical protein
MPANSRWDLIRGLKGYTKKDKRAAGVVKATVHKQGSTERFKFGGRLEISVGQWVI